MLGRPHGSSLDGVIIAQLALAATACGPSRGAAATPVANQSSAKPAGAIAQDWQRIRNDAFSFSAPGDVKAMPVQGIDSYVGHYESPSLRIVFDFGRYSNDSLANHLDAPSRGDFTWEHTTIDGRPAKLGSWRDDARDDINQGFLTGCGVYVPGSGADQLDLTIWSRDPAVDTCLGILRSIAFNPPAP